MRAFRIRVTIAASMPALALALLVSPGAAHETVGASIEAISQRLRAEPANAALLLRRAELHRLAGAWESAEDDLNRAEFLKASQPGLAFARASLAMDRGDARAALRALDGAPPEPGEAGAWFALRARALAAEQRTPEAIAAWTEALRSLAHPQPDDFLARARLQVGAGRLGEARAGLREGLARLGPAVGLERALSAIGGETPGPIAAAAPIATPRAQGAAPAATLDVVTLTRGPYLQLATESGITIRWRTSAAADGRVRLGTSPGVYTLAVDDPVLATEHAIAVSGLDPATRYYYTVGPSADALAGGDSLTFRTLPAAGTSPALRIWSIGDSGVPGANQNRVRDAFLAYTGNRAPDVWLMLGDNAYDSGLDSEYQSGLFTPYRSLLQRWPLWPTRGNHDFTYSGGSNDYYDFFTLPATAEAGGLPSGSEAFYAFDVGAVHFICLDSEGSDRSAGGPMLTWLAADLAANTRPWTIAFWHHPPYTHGSHDSDDSLDSGGRMRDMREHALPILDAAGVDLVLAGHSHSYERSCLLDGHYGISTTLTPAMRKNAGDGRPSGGGAYGKPTFGAAPHQGAVYAVAGSAAQLAGGTLDHPVMVTSLNVLGSMVIDVDGDRLEGRFLSDSGSVRDSFAIVKGAATDVHAHQGPAGGLRLGPALPNPFREGVDLEFTLAAAGSVRLEIFDAAGRRVAAVRRGHEAAGTHSVRWDGRGDRGEPLPAGIYLAGLSSEGLRATRRIALVR